MDEFVLIVCVRLASHHIMNLNEASSLGKQKMKSVENEIGVKIPLWPGILNAIFFL